MLKTQNFTFSLYSILFVCMLILGMGAQQLFQTWKQSSVKTVNPLDPAVIRKHSSLLALSKSLTQQQKLKEALPYAQQALELLPTDLPTIQHLGYLSLYLSDVAAAAVLYTKLIELAPDNPQALYNYGYLYGLMLCQGEVAKPILQKAIALAPEYTMAHTVLGEMLLMHGDFEAGWKEFGWNWGHRFTPGVWDNVKFKGKKVVLKDVQGLGDSLQFVRFLKVLKAKGATTILYTTCKPLVPLYEKCSYIDRVLIEENTIPASDLEAPIMALPMIFNVNPTTIPREFPYLEADPKLVTFWREKLSHDKNFKVGLIWHSDQRCELSKPEFARKSVLLKQMHDLLRMQGVSFYSLQKFEGLEELKELPSDIKIHEFGEDFDKAHGRFMDTAAVIKNMDLVISVDTATAHLAGALNVPVWLMLTFPADWRWMLNRSDSPWYPTMKIFRREQDRGWESVIHNMESELRKTVTTKN